MQRRLDELKAIITESHYHLLAIFTVIAFLITAGVMPQWKINLLLLGVIIGIFGLAQKEKKVPDLHGLLVIIALVIVLTTRTLPYLHTHVPLGYDPGLYRYLFQHPFAEHWTQVMYPLPFTAAMGLLGLIFPVDWLLAPFLIAVTLLTTYLFYRVLKQESTGIAVIAALLYSISITQFAAYWFSYHKNLIGVAVLLVSLPLIKNCRRINPELIIIGTALAGIHRPAFFIFGATYLAYLIITGRQWRQEELLRALSNGIAILLLGALVNADRIATYFLPGFLVVSNGIISTGDGGTFFALADYLTYIYPLIPFAIIGAAKGMRRHPHYAIAGIITAVIVVAKLFFYQRFIIYLDLFIIIFAAIGFGQLLASKKTMGMIVTYGFLLLFIIIALQHAWQSQPLISDQEFEEIKSIDGLTEKDAHIIVTDSHYSPWLKGWTDAKIIAPGLFDANRMTRDEWFEYWEGKNRENYMNRYEKPLYIHVGERQPHYDFNTTCYKTVLDGVSSLYLYTC